MGILKVIWTLTALNQRNQIFEYWNERNQSIEYSQKLNKKLKERINIIKSFPEIGLKTNYKTYRLLSVRNFSIVYKVHNETIIIAGIWDNRQDPVRLLEILKKM